MAQRKPRHHTNPDFRHPVPVPMPAVEDVEQQLWTLLSPSVRAPRRLERRDPHRPQRVSRLRARLLTLPVRVAISVSLGGRRLGAVAEVQRVLAREGRLGVRPLQVSEQALATRLDTLPAAALGALFAEVCARLQAQPLPTGPGREDGARGRAPFPLSARRDGATRAALRNKTQAVQGIAGTGLAGRLRVRVEAVSQRPCGQLYPEAAAANANRFAPQLLAAVPAGGLVVFDRGCFSFWWVDDFTAPQQYVVPRLRHQTA